MNSGMPEKYFVIDFENTGGSLWYGHKITAYGICIVENTGKKYEITKTVMNYVNPNRQIPKFIEDLIGIKTEDVNNSKYLPIEEEFKNLEELLTPDMVFTAHCVGVDYGMYNYLHYTKYKSHFETITLDTCRLAKKIIGFEKGSIGDVARELDITCGKHHQPDFDAFVAAQVLIKSIDLAESNQELKKSFLSYLVKYPRPQTLKKLLKFNLMNEAAG